MRQVRRYHVWEPKCDDGGGDVSLESDLLVNRVKNGGLSHRDDTVKRGHKKFNTFSLRSSILPEV